MEQAQRTNRKSDFYINTASICGAAAASLGVLGLFAWISGLRVLSSIAPAYIPMAPDTALIFAALGSTLLLARHRALPNRGRSFLALIAALASVYGLLKFVEYFVKVDLTLENILFPVADQLGSYPINRMSPITGALFLLCGTALLSILWDKGGDLARSLVGGLGILVFIAGFIATTGYLFASPLLYGGDIIPLAATTAFAFLFLGIGLVAAAGPADIFVRPLLGSSIRARMLRAFLPLTATAVLVEGILQEVITKSSEVNHALLSAAFSLIFVAITAAVVTQMARVISHAVEVAEVERKKAEESLKQERNLLRTLIDNVPDQIFAKDMESRFILNNQSYARLKGTVPEALLGKTDYDFDPPDLAARYQAEDQAIIHSGRGIVDREEVAVDGSGKKSWLLTTKVPLPDDRGQIIGVVGTKRDITERKQVEENLRLFAKIFESTAEGILITDAQANIVSVNGAFTAITGYTAEQAIGKTPSLFKRAGQDAEFFKEMWRALRELHQWQGEIGSVRPDGKAFRVWVTINGVKDQAGALAHYVGILRDITARKQAEEDLLKFKLGIERSDEAIFVTDANGIIVYVNPGFEKIYRYTREQALGQTPRILKSGALGREAYEHFWNKLLAKQVVAGELINRTRDGRLLKIESSANPILSEEGNILGFLAIQRDITQRKQVEEALERSEATLAQAGQMAHLGAWEIEISHPEDLNTNPLRWSDEVYRIFGYEPGAVQVTNDLFFQHVHPDDRPPVEQAVSQAIAEKRAYSIEHRIVRPDGTERIVSEHAEVTFDPQGRPTRMLGAVQDITELKRVEEKLATRAREFTALYETTRDLATTRDWSTLLQTIAERAVALLNASCGSIFLYDANRQDLEIVVTVGPELPVGTHFALGEGMAGRVAQTLTPMIVDDYRTWEHRSPKIGAIPFSASIEVPMLYGGELIGVLAVDEVGDTTRKFIQEDAHLLSLFAGQAASAVRNARLFEESQRRLRETLLLNRVVASSSSALEPHTVLTAICQELAHALNLPHSGLALFDADRTRLTVVAEYREEGRPSSLGAVIPIIGNQATQYAIEHRVPVVVPNAQTDERQSAIHDLEKQLGVVSLLIVPLVSRGQVIGTLGLVTGESRDFSPDEIALAQHLTAAASQAFENAQLYAAVQQELVERKRAEEALANERNILRTLIDSIPDYIYVKDTKSHFVAGNLAIAQSFGKTRPEEIYGQSDFDYHAPELAAQFFADEQGIFRMGQPLINREEFVIEPAGNQKWLITTKMPLRDGQGKIVGLVGVGRDITERRRAEQALKASEQYARNIIDSSLDMIITVDRERRIVEFNRAAETAFGYLRDEILGKNISLLYADPAEGQTVHQTTFEKGILVREILNRRKNGEVFPSLLSAAVMQDDKGERIGVVGVSRDITEPRRAEEALRRRLAELGALHTVAVASAEAPDEDTLIERATRVVGENLFPDNFGVLQLDQARSSLRLHPSYRADTAIKDRVVPLGQGITGQVAATGKAVRCGDVLNQPGYLQFDARIRSELCVPLKVGDRILGVINAESARSYAFTDADERLLVTLASQLASAIDRLRSQAELRRLATLDELTCVFNRRYFFELAQRELNRSRRLGHPLSAIMLDIDRFKAVNDMYGHANGDRVLRVVAAECSKHIREIDLLGRYGGEEFTILLVECDLSSAQEVAERLRMSVAEQVIPTSRGPIQATVSLGISQVKEDTEDIASLVDCADSAMYAAKAAGRNRIAVG